MQQKPTGVVKWRIRVFGCTFGSAVTRPNQTKKNDEAVSWKET